ncbi:hypothetical protein FDECE_15370 [Fusarium decemcellulare]|nr:hypothetical protein FDECE_15370 [Fusarium decemcellulare]
MDRRNFRNENPHPLASNPSFGPAPYFQAQGAPIRGAEANLSLDSTSQMNSDPNSWVTSAHQAISNAIQASGLPILPMENDMSSMDMSAPMLHDGPGYNIVAPPNSPVGGVAQPAGMDASYGTGASAP